MGLLAAGWPSVALPRTSAFKASCRPRGTQLAAANRYARVYYDRGDETAALCLPGRGSSRALLLAERVFPAPAIDLVGPYLGYAGQAEDGLAHVDNVVVVDVRHPDDLRLATDYVGGVGSLKVSRRGSVSWIVCPFGYLSSGKLSCTEGGGSTTTGRAPRGVYIRERGSPDTPMLMPTAQSRHIEVDSLRRKGNRVYWRHSHHVRHATFR